MRRSADSEIRHCAKRIKNLLELYRGREIPPAALTAIEMNTEQLLSAIYDRRKPAPVIDAPNIVQFTRKGRG